jgi:MraZ protein
MASNPKTRPVYRGNQLHVIDDKNRVTIPSAWRIGKAEDFHLIPNAATGSLTILPPEVFLAAADKIAKNLPEEEYLSFKRFFYGQAHDVSVDKQGRLLLPDVCCKRLKLRGEALISGAHDRFEIWNPADWEKFREGSGKSTIYAAEMRKVL